LCGTDRFCFVCSRVGSWASNRYRSGYRAVRSSDSPNPGVRKGNRHGQDPSVGSHHADDRGGRRHWFVDRVAVAGEQRLTPGAHVHQHRRDVDDDEPGHDHDEAPKRQRPRKVQPRSAALSEALRDLSRGRGHAWSSRGSGSAEHRPNVCRAFAGASDTKSPS
jgi:hypothetical protein